MSSLETGLREALATCRTSSSLSLIQFKMLSNVKSNISLRLCMDEDELVLTDRLGSSLLKFSKSKFSSRFLDVIEVVLVEAAVVAAIVYLRIMMPEWRTSQQFSVFSLRNEFMIVQSLLRFAAFSLKQKSDDMMPTVCAQVFVK